MKYNQQRSINISVLTKLKEDINFYYTHKKLVDTQRNCYKLQLDNLKYKEGILIMDFKENLKLGGGPREFSQDFYNKQPCSVLGMCLIYCDKDGIIRKKYINYFSDILSHDGLFVKDCLSKLLTSSTIPILTSLSIWTDNARHFHSKEIAYCLLYDIPRRFSLKTEWNLYGEYHGKTLVDGHFGLLSRWINEGEKYQGIYNKEDCISFLKEQVRCSNIYKSSTKHPDQLDIDFNIYRRLKRPKTIYQLDFTNFSQFQCFTSIYFKGEWNIIGYITSEQKDGNILKASINIKNDDRDTKHTLIKNIEEDPDISKQQLNKNKKRIAYFNKQGIKITIDNNTNNMNIDTDMDMHMDMDIDIDNDDTIYVDAMDIDQLRR
jgi:hypothetical protein